MLSLKDTSGSVAMFLVLTLAFQPPVTSLKHRNMLCEQVQECVCEFPTGQGVNLTNLATSLVFNDTEHGLIFHFNPCKDANSPCPSGSLLCLFDEKSNTTLNLAPNHNADFTSQGFDGPIFLNYDNGAVLTEIELECWEKNETTFLWNTKIDRNEPEDEVKYHLLLQSPEVCQKTLNVVASSGLSDGGLFFIVLVLVGCAYILLGAVANHFLRGATGWEMIPHNHFWRNLPNSIMDGVKFVVNGCRSPPSYEEI